LIHKSLDAVINNQKRCKNSLFFWFYTNYLYLYFESGQGKDLDQRIYMTVNSQKEVRERYLVPMDILLKTPQEYNDPQKKFFESKIIV